MGPSPVEPTPSSRRGAAASERGLPPALCGKRVAFTQAQRPKSTHQQKYSHNAEPMRCSKCVASQASRSQYWFAARKRHLATEQAL
jgi:hypothetical protein